MGQTILKIFTGMDALRDLRKRKLSLQTPLVRLDVVVHHPQPVAIKLKGFLHPFMESPRPPFIDRKPEIHKRHLAFPVGFSPKLPDGPGIQRRNFGKKLLGIKRIGRAVCGGVVDQDKTVDRPCLAQETIQTFQQEVLAVISHKNYKNFLGVSGDSSPIQRLLSDSASCKLFLSGLASFIKMNPPKEKVALRSHSTLF